VTGFCDDSYVISEYLTDSFCSVEYLLQEPMHKNPWYVCR